MFSELRRSLVLKTAMLFAVAALVPFVLAALLLFGQMATSFNRMVDEVNRHVVMLLEANIEKLSLPMRTGS